MGHYYQSKVDLIRVWIKPKKQFEKKHGNRSEYTSLEPEQIKSWEKEFNVEKVSKLIPAGRYTKTEFEKFLINGGRSKKDHEQHLKSLQFLKTYNKTHNTSFKTLEDLVKDKRRIAREHKIRESQRKLERQKKLQEYKNNQEAILRLSAVKLGIEKGVYTQEILDQPDAKKLLKEAFTAQIIQITNLIKQIHETPLLERKRFKSQITHIKSQLHKEIDKL